jgi:hypothetical protein
MNPLIFDDSQSDAGQATAASKKPTDIVQAVLGGSDAADYMLSTSGT